MVPDDIEQLLRQIEKGKEWSKVDMPASEPFVSLQDPEGGRGNVAWRLTESGVDKRPGQNSAGCSSRIISSYPESNATLQKEESGAEYTADGFRVRAYSKFQKLGGPSPPCTAKKPRKGCLYVSPLHSRL